MKKVAFFVEGETEQEFVEKLLTEIAGQKNISIRSLKFSGGGSNSPRITQFIDESLSNDAIYEALIYVSSTDNRVNSDIREQQDSLRRRNYSKIIGLRDLRGDQNGRQLTHDDLPNIERAAKAIERFCSPLQAKIIIVVMEIETWFLADIEHYSCIAPNLTRSFIFSNEFNIGFNPYQDDLTLRLQPAEDLATLYQLAGKTYTKRKRSRQRTVDCLDYANIYLYLPLRIEKLAELIFEIDDFLS